MTADEGRPVRAREAIGSAVQYGLLFGFAAVAAAISAHGLVGFARANMGLPGAWPYLLWGALDGAAGLCAVLLMRRAARGEPAVAPRLAVWGLVAASSVFNWTHAPGHPGAREAFALMPVIAATLFEFSLRETRHTAQHAERILPGLAWLRPVERVRVRMCLAADGKVAAEAATRRVRVESAARRLHVLREVLAAQPAARPRPVAAHRVHRAERRAQAALSRAHFADPAVAVEVLRQVQVLTLTQTLARLDYATPAGAQAILAGLITHGPGVPANGARPAPAPAVYPGPAQEHIPLNGSPGVPADVTPAPGWLAAPNGLPSRAPPSGGRPLAAALTAPHRNGQQSGHGDLALIEAATRIVTGAQANGERLSQVGLAQQLRAQGYHIANERLRWLAVASGLESRRERP